MGQGFLAYIVEVIYGGQVSTGMKDTKFCSGSIEFGPSVRHTRGDNRQDILAPNTTFIYKVSLEILQLELSLLT